MPAKLSTHVLDLTAGRPAAGMKIQLLRHGKESVLLKTVTTNADGRMEAPLLDGAQLAAGNYELVFHVRDYFAARGVECPLLDQVPVRFSISDAAASYHIPLLVTPWSYSTYRGS
ncbi:MAG TPA: hydroxyisourate hydrolase [Opitutaceae bacterium]|nr:hydroxyisourate hydrolase [Opitutaceae bacterium]